MKDLLEVCCGLDVHKEMIAACLLSGSLGTEPKEEVREFSTLLSGLEEMRGWLKENNCRDIAMESTGVYWFPIYNVLEAGAEEDFKFNITVANPYHMKNVPGKKTDIKDSRWIAGLLRAGLLEPSYIPPREIRELRDWTRYRRTLVQEMTGHKNRIEKQLQACGFKLSTVLTDIFGKTGMDLIRKLCEAGSMGYTMDSFRRAVKEAMGGASSGTDGYTKIMGNAAATAEQMKAYLKAKNPNVAQIVLDMVPLYLSEGKAEGVRGDVAFAQSCLETGNFTFSGSAVTLSQNNFCGMGVTSNGMKGNSFGTPQLGIRAQVQHLKAYASTDELKNTCIDPRFKYVTRGCAEYVEWLGQKENPAGKGWAAGAGYGEKILSILKGILGTAGGAPKPAPAETEAWYRVRKSWADASSQKGAFKSLENAKKCADENSGHSVFDESGKALYTKAAALQPYLVRVSIPDLNIRQGPGTDKPKTGKVTGVGVFTIVEEADGKGASRWGKLKSNAGWISLDYASRI